MLDKANRNKLREIFKELIKITGIRGDEEGVDFRDKRLLEHIHLYFMRIKNEPIYMEKEE